MTMIKYHPDTRFLTDYTAGSLPESQALCVAAHLHYCASCRMRVNELTELGTTLFMTQTGENVSEASFTRIMDKLDNSPGPVSVDDQSSPSSRRKQALPPAIHKLTGGNFANLNWRKVGKSFSYSTIRMQQDPRETSLLSIKAGGTIPKHHHQGDEITVILKGSFSDQEDKYQVGDYVVRTNGETHAPVASQDEDCICLATLDAPIVMKNPIYRLLMPLFNSPTK
jgi:putative transcriptional regulator